jgi:tRNA/tmRNA/rRNA uracil-C5-methylase (TrmA/RlmC/RlmD family)
MGGQTASNVSGTSFLQTNSEIDKKMYEMESQLTENTK